jgi:hypothetical protein
MAKITAAELLALLAAMAALVGSLWKAFEQLAVLRERIKENLHRIELLQQAMEFARDELKLGLRGISEVADHVRARTREDNKDLTDRVSDLERFLAKTTEFEVRDS